MVARGYVSEIDFSDVATSLHVGGDVSGKPMDVALGNIVIRGETGDD